MCRMLKATLTPRESCWITGVRLTLYHRSWLVNLIFPPIQSSLRNRVLPPSSESSSMHQRPHHQANPLTKFRWIPRWITCELSSSVQLHVFTDASERAYGACLYVRSVSLSGEVHVHLLTAKSKVAPVKSTTIPRLELCAALLGSRLYMKDGSLRCFLVETALHESPTSAHVRVSFGERLTQFARYPSPLLLKTLQRGEYVESSHSPQPRPRQVGATVTSWCNGSPRIAGSRGQDLLMRTGRAHAFLLKPSFIFA
nr:uncharacterized protein LOC126054057 isoform X5 [Helicoverpa armigera]